LTYVIYAVNSCSTDMILLLRFGLKKIIVEHAYFDCWMIVSKDP